MATKKKEEPETAPVTEGAEGEAPAAPAPRFGKKQKIIAGAAAGLLLFGGGGAAFFIGSGKEHPKEGAKAGKSEEAAKDEEAEPEAEGESEGEGEGKSGELPLVDVPPMIVNLRTAGGEPRYLKLHFMIEARNASKTDALQKKLPAIIDSFQPFLRELRPEDLSGSAAVFRIKEEMLVRTTAAVGTGMVKDILIQDIVQQ